MSGLAISSSPLIGSDLTQLVQFLKIKALDVVVVVLTALFRFGLKTQQAHKRTRYPPAPNRVIRKPKINIRVVHFPASYRRLILLRF